MHVIIKLTKKQMEILKPLFDQVNTDFLAGKPGALFGQVNETGFAVIKYVDHETAKKIGELNGVKEPTP